MDKKDVSWFRGEAVGPQFAVSTVAAATWRLSRSWMSDFGGSFGGARSIPASRAVPQTLPRLSVYRSAMCPGVCSNFGVVSSGGLMVY
jgi:hypothetical protein